MGLKIKEKNLFFQLYALCHLLYAIGYASAQPCVRLLGAYR
jgi:hypothetical protein